MANVIINDTHLNNIASAIREKNGTTTKYKPSEMPAAISAIETGSGSSEWQPQPDWWDIEKILEEDTEEYAGKMIILFTNSYDNFDVYRCSANKVVTSDGGVYTDTSQTYFNHTWDISKDKECSLGYKTRYVIWYYISEGVQIINDVINMNKGILYVVSKNINLRTYGNGGFVNNRTIEAIKLINGTLTAGGGYTNTSLKKIFTSQKIELSNFNTNYRLQTDLTEFNFNTPNSRSIAYFFQNNYQIDVVGEIDTSNITNFDGAFRDCTLLKTVKKIDFNSATSYSNVFQRCYALCEISNIQNIKITGFSVSDSTLLNHDSLIRILNALYDYASEGSTDTYTLIIGTVNLNKLSDEEKAIATNKGWTLVERG